MVPIQRDYAIDYFKGLLVIGMVYAHVLQFFSEFEFFPSTFYISEFFNLITFSGFVFCFGYVCQLAYYRKSFRRVFKNMLISGLKILVAFYISGVAFQIFIGNEPMSLETILPVIFLQVIPGWSEFLVSFSLIILIGLLLFKVFVWISKHPIVLWSIVVLLLATTFIDYGKINSTYIGLLIGTTHFPVFPVLQYMPFYLIGIYFAKYQIRFNWQGLLIGASGTVVFIIYLWKNNFHLPERFPPSFYWVIGSSFFLYVYYLFSRLLDRWGKGLGLLQIMGGNVLFYLLLSNILIFSLSSKVLYFVVGPWNGLVMTICILLLISFFYFIIVPRPTGRRK